VEELELVSCQLEPKVEGRILQLTPVRCHIALVQKWSNTVTEDRICT
jgi:hypothetical protein